jgi:hypothetical protein
MSLKELDRIKVIELVLNKRLTQAEGSRRLGVSTRHFRRLQQSYRQNQERGVISKRRGKQSNSRLSEALTRQVIDLISSKYSDFGPTLAHEKLIGVHGLQISVESVRKLMMKHGFWKGRSPKVRRQAQQMRTRRPCFGELVQIDGSPHDWFEGRADPCCLLVFIDDATSQLVALHFVDTECTQGYFDATIKHIEKYGRPIAYYSDKHGIFRVNTPEAKSGNGETQYGRACRELGIEIINANSPQAKGRVERANQTLQDRLVKEMRLRDINCIDEANNFLPEFIEQYNQKFGVTPASTTDAHRKELPSADQLDLIFSEQEYRTISKQLEVSYKNTIYQIQTKTPSYNMRKAKLKVCNNKGKITLIYKGKALDYKVFDKKNRPAQIVDSKSINKTIDKRIKSYKPKTDHPWRCYPKNINNHRQTTYTQGAQAQL